MTFRNEFDDDGNFKVFGSNISTFRFKEQQPQNDNDSMHPINDDVSESILAVYGCAELTIGVNPAVARGNLCFPFAASHEIIIKDEYFRTLLKQPISSAYIDEFRQMYLYAIPLQRMLKQEPHWMSVKLNKGADVFEQCSFAQDKQNKRKLAIPQTGIAYIYDVKAGGVVVWFKDGAEYKKVFDGSLEKFTQAHSRQTKQLETWKTEYTAKHKAFIELVSNKAADLCKESYLDHYAFLMQGPQFSNWINLMIDKAQDFVIEQGEY